VTGPLEPRAHIPDLDVVARQLIEDVTPLVRDARQTDKDAAAYLDAVGTLTGLDENDLVQLAIDLAKRIAAFPEP